MGCVIAGIDVHKKMIAVVVTDVAGEGEYQFERRRFGATPDQLRLLAQWLLQQEVEEAVMESTAQYWKPVWGALERGIGSRTARSGKGPVRHRVRCIWHRPNPIAVRRGGRTILPMGNAW